MDGKQGGVQVFQPGKQDNGGKREKQQKTNALVEHFCLNAETPNWLAFSCSHLFGLKTTLPESSFIFKFRGLLKMILLLKRLHF